MKGLTLTIAIAASLLALGTSGCYYDDKETLYPSTTCDTASVTYSGSINAIVLQNCAFSGCHAGAAPASGLDLATYSGVQAVALNGKLAGVINHTSGFSPMPKNAAKLSACNISKITKWIREGAQNN
ncbi:MAG: hypothetical protein V4649_16260 [Bacteroidota bacterium]